jgi:hypothetical protein
MRSGQHVKHGVLGMFENHSLGVIAVTAMLMGGSLFSAPIAQADAHTVLGRPVQDYVPY